MSLVSRCISVTPVVLQLPTSPSVKGGLACARLPPCQPGLAHAGTDPMLLPRLVDTTGLTDAEFVAWISGSWQLLPQRANVSAGGQLMGQAPPPRRRRIILFWNG